MASRGATGFSSRMTATLGQPDRPKPSADDTPPKHVCASSGTTHSSPRAKASGYTNRSFCPDAVRYMSVTSATHRPAVTHSDTGRDKKETARLAAFPQTAGRFPRVWQVLGSNLIGAAGT